jgi:starch-binding outer membrane protein, SusD/RagB family
MKILSKYYKCVFIGSLLIILMSACSKLDYDNTSSISPDNVWSSETMINAFLTDIYGGLLPGWSFNGGSSDEGIHEVGEFSDYLRGIISIETTGYGLDYTYIDKINYFLYHIKDVSSSVLTDTEKNQMIGQASFWRAWDYWLKVSNVGGVPLITEPQDVSNTESLYVSRAKTSECVAQIISDLDTAISDLPDSWGSSDYGRIDKGAAMAFKGRVLLWYASPLFNTSGDQTRWQTAYTANKEAVEYLTEQGKGLYSSYADLWYDEQNKEAIMVNQFYYPDHAFDQNYIRPVPLSINAGDYNSPYLPMLLAFPKKDGSTLEFDESKLSDATYNSQFLTDFYENRDDRFYTTVFCGGTEYPTPDMETGVRYWGCWKKVTDSSSMGYSYISLLSNQLNSGSSYGPTGFWDIKGLDKSLTQSIHDRAETDWIEIRYAEVLMNYGECANEIGNASEALQVLYDIRNRAGITAGTNGKYGITASSQSDIREAYVNERFVEFAYENKRMGDIRRWKRFDILNDHKYRSCFYVVLNDGESVDSFDWTSDITDSSVRAKFHAVYIENLDGTGYQFNVSTSHYFYPISQTDLNRNSKLEQNNEWGGSFDPVQ